MKPTIPINDIKEYFNDKFTTFGTTPQGADWNSSKAQETRFEQLLKIIDPDRAGFSLLDYGCGYGALIHFLNNRGYQNFEYFGFDILVNMILAAQREFADSPSYHFSPEIEAIPVVNYAICSGVFNIRLENSYEAWTEYVISCLDRVNSLTNKGFSSNFLTKYSDADRMLNHLYYADPCFIFDYCKTHYSKNVALLHDYNLYDFTILVRK
jgi:SAM-dependent methyltransferase